MIAHFVQNLGNNLTLEQMLKVVEIESVLCDTSLTNSSEYME